MPVFIFGGAEKWFRQVFDKNFTDIVQEVSPSEIAQIFMTSLAGKPRERQRYLQEQSMVDYSKSDVCRSRTAESGWACGFSNFLAPVDNNGVLDLAKAGQTIPLK